jgi:excisionase family DNA binding protein
MNPGRLGDRWATKKGLLAPGPARPPGHGDRLLAVSEVAKLLSVSDATVYALCARGILAHVRVLNAIRIAPTALNALLSSPQRRVGGDD